MELPKQVYLMMFMGQSNMAGRGTACHAPAVEPGAGYEFKAITRPDTLCPLAEPLASTKLLSCAVVYVGRYLYETVL